jgi:hypothetical protein
LSSSRLFGYDACDIPGGAVTFCCGAIIKHTLSTFVHQWTLQRGFSWSNHKSAIPMT